MVLGVRVISRSLSAGAVVVEVAIETHSARVWLELHVYLFLRICVVSSVGKYFVGPYIDPIRLPLESFFVQQERWREKRCSAQRSLVTILEKCLFLQNR